MICMFLYVMNAGKIQVSIYYKSIKWYHIRYHMVSPSQGTLHVHSMSAWVFSLFCSLLPQSNNLHIKLIGEPKLLLGVQGVFLHLVDDYWNRL